MAMEDLSLHILDIAQNSIKADANQLKIIILEKPSRDVAVLEIIDNGKGMDDETLRILQEGIKEDSEILIDGTKRVGLKNIASRMRLMYGENYVMKIDSRMNEGTKVFLSFEAKC